MTTLAIAPTTCLSALESVNEEFSPQRLGCPRRLPQVLYEVSNFVPKVDGYRSEYARESGFRYHVR